MGYIHNIGFENFRVFEKMQKFEFAPITILTGPNNSGKSTLTKGLKLLAANAKLNELSRIDIDKSDIFVDWNSTKNWNSKSEEITFYLGDSKVLNQNISIYKSFKDSSEQEIIIKQNEDIIFSIADIGYEDEYILQEITLNRNWLQEQLDKIQVTEKIIEIESIKPKSQGDSNVFIYENHIIDATGWSEAEIQNRKNEIDKETNSGSNESFYHSTNADLRYTKLVEQLNSLSESEQKEGILSNKYILFETKSGENFKFTYATSYENEHTLVDTILNSRHSCNLAISSINKELFKSYHQDVKIENEEKIISELCSKKYQIALSYFFNEIGEAIKSFNSSLKSIDFDEITRSINDRFIIKNKDEKLSLILENLAYRTKAEVANYFLIKYLKHFEIADDVVVEKFENIAYTVKLYREGKSVALNDLGYGFSQIFKLLLNIHEVYLKTLTEVPFDHDQRTIILEEPEVNLHPNLQSRIADLISDAIKTYHIQFIIETHSEYLIRKLQYLIAKKELKAENVIIHYFNSDKDKKSEGETCKEIRINEDGVLTDSFGGGFFDEATRLKFDLLKLHKIQGN